LRNNSRLVVRDTFDAITKGARIGVRVGYETPNYMVAYNRLPR